MKTIRVLINPDGISCREVNPLPKPVYAKTSFGKIDKFFNRRLDIRYKESEASLRSFEIVSEKKSFFVEPIGAIQEKHEPGSIHTAYILSDGTGQAKAAVKILD